MLDHPPHHGLSVITDKQMIIWVRIMMLEAWKGWKVRKTSDNFNRLKTILWSVEPAPVLAVAQMLLESHERQSLGVGDIKEQHFTAHRYSASPPVIALGRVRWQGRLLPLPGPCRRHSLRHRHVHVSTVIRSHIVSTMSYFVGTFRQAPAIRVICESWANVAFQNRG